MAKMQLDMEDLFINPVQTEVVKEETTEKPVVKEKKTATKKTPTKKKETIKNDDSIPLTRIGIKRSFVLYLETWNELKEYCDTNGLKISNVVDKFIRQGLDGEK